MVDGQAIEAKSNNCQVWCCKSANPTPIVHPCSCWLGGSMHSNGLSMLISLRSKFLQDTQHKFYRTIQTTCQQVATGAYKLDIDLGLDWFLDLPMKKKKRRCYLFHPWLTSFKHCKTMQHFTRSCSHPSFGIYISVFGLYCAFPVSHPGCNKLPKKDAQLYGYLQ